MKAILLAAGFGKRLRPLTIHTPKCLVEIHGIPLLEYWLDDLIRADIQKIFINTHYLSEKVNAFISEYKEANRIFISYEAKLLGTARTIASASNFIENDKNFFVIHADNFSKFNIKEMISLHNHRDSDVEITMMSFETDKPESCGILEVNNKRVVGFYEKIKNPPGRNANGAVYIFSNKVLDYIKKNPSVKDISMDLIPRFLGKIQVYENKIYHRDIGDLESLEMARNGL